MNRKGILFIISGPSGVGKGTVLAEACKKLDDISVSVSATTRSPRTGEIDGVHYHFITKERFAELIANNGMYEYVEVLDCFYGTPKRPVLEKLASGQDVILEIETLGADNIRKQTDCVSIFIAPPSASELRKRLSSRGTETKEQIAKRLKKCESELPCMFNYDYIVVNEKVDQCAEEIMEIINAERHKVSKNKNLIEKIINS